MLWQTQPTSPWPSERRRTLQGQLDRLGAAAIDLWVLRGFIEEQCCVEDAMAIVKACTWRTRSMLKRRAIREH